MAVFDIAYQYVLDDTGREDMQDIIKRRIQRAVLAMHRIDFWKKDFVEQVFIFQNEQAVQIINKGLFPRFRAIGYLRKYNADAASISDPSIFDGAVGEFFGEMNPQQALDGYGYNRTNKMYESGSTIKLMSSEAIRQVLIGWFIDPLLEPIEACDSWILTEYPGLIAAHAKRRIFKDIGKDQESRDAQLEYDDELLKLQANNIRLAVLQMPG